MANVFQTLADITTGYTVFETDQVLTEAQLNGLGNYLDDEARLTRVIMIGVGIGCGLRVRLDQEGVILGRGAGSTTDGDLFYVAADTRFDRFKPYDETAPEYKPFRLQGQAIPAFELVAAGVKDDKAVALPQFAGAGHGALADMAAVLLMESCEKDEDLCSGTDCDNRGKHVHHTPKLILVEKPNAARFREDVEVARSAAVALQPVVPDRVLLSPATDTPLTLAAAYRAGCNAINAKLGAQLERVIAASGSLLADVFPADPTAGWKARLADYAGAFAGAAAGFQYYYDFLKDLAETWNDFYRLLQEDSTVCCPALDAFPKHLALGYLVSGADPEENRTGWYPSPMVSTTIERRGHARFLAQKLHALIMGFKVPADAGAPIRITPSRFEDSWLEERAIPFYYDPSAAPPVHGVWSWQLARRAMATWNYGYNSAAWHAEGGAAAPLATQCGRFAFFRIEGHLNKPVADAVQAIQVEIVASNLPFAVRSVVLDRDRGKIVLRPPRYTDLNRFEYLLRGATANQLEDLKSFTDTLGEQVDRAVDQKVITSTPTVDVANEVKILTARKRDITATKVENAGRKLAAADPTWDEDAADAVTAAAELRYELGTYAKTDLLAPADALVASSQLPWLKWVGDIIQATNEAEDDRLLFQNFVKEHPGVEHFGGVTRGGTFVLIYEPGGRVVGDVMLPYYAPEPVPVKPAEPPLTRPPRIRFPWAVPGGIRVTPSIPRLIDDSIKFQVGERLGDITTKLERNTAVLEAYQRVSPPQRGFTPIPSPGADPLLNIRVQDMETKARTIDVLRTRALDPSLDEPTRAIVEGQLRDAETGLAASINDTSKYVAASGQDVAPGSDGFVAMAAAAEHIERLNDPVARTAVKETLSGIPAANQPGLRTMIGTMLRRPGF